MPFAKTANLFIGEKGGRKRERERAERAFSGRRDSGPPVRESRKVLRADALRGSRERG